MSDRRIMTRESARRGLGISLALVLSSMAWSVPKPTDEPEPIAVPGIENVFRVGPSIFSGGEPRGPEDFAALRKLGIKTVLSVDGSSPDVEDAREAGLRYVHLPIGYDGVPRPQAIRIIQAARSLPGPIYIHCHHGKHRGPAAVAVCGLALEGWSETKAIAWLEQAGTSHDYRGLYESVADFRPPTAEELEGAGTEFPESATVPELVEAMVAIDARWDALKAVQKAGYRTPADHPDVDPPHEALQLAELFRESARMEEVGVRGKAFRRGLEAADLAATVLEAALRGYDDAETAKARAEVESAFAAVSKRCTDCHARHRDN